MSEKKEKLRIDKYLWSIRIYKTRTLAAEGCDKGKVKQNSASVKASKTVNVGDEYEIKTEARKWVIKVTALLDHRVQFSEAVNFYLDLTPNEDLEHTKTNLPSFYTGKRQSKTGRPTKKERRELGDYLEGE